MQVWQTEVVNKLEELGLRGEVDGKTVRVLEHRRQIARLTDESEAWTWIDARQAKLQKAQRTTVAVKAY